MGGVGGSGGEMMSALKEGAPVPSEAKRRGRSVLGKPKRRLLPEERSKFGGKFRPRKFGRKFRPRTSFAGKNKVHAPSEIK